MFRLAAVTLLAAGLFAQTAPKDRMVVLISLDGFPAFAWNDPRLPVPTLRRLAREGAMAKAMTTVNPTVTWPNHTAMVTGVEPAKHGVLANGSILQTGAAAAVKVEPWIDKEKMVHVPTLYDAVHKSGLTTAQVDWVAIHKAKTITFPFPEVPDAAGKIEQEMIAAGIVTADEIQQFGKGNILWRDQIWTDAGVHIIKRHKPNLLLFHLLSLDSGHHSYGPRSLAGNTAMAFLDACVARLLDAIRAAGMEKRTTILIVSDHGFKAYTKTIQGNAVLAAAGLDKRAYVLAEGGSALVYVPATSDVAAVRQALQSAEGVAAVIAPDEYASYGLPHPSNDKQMSQLFLAAKNGYSFGGGVNGGPVVTRPSPGGAHGYLSTDKDLDAIFLASGYGVKPGVTVDRVRNIDIAPTIAKILGVKFEGVDGRVIAEVLR
ncbi:MAG: alkaline phosphatase family protein [Bryobacterales bacterium]|nr:alkaline phosphatase family protein [Bryobacterales bacterium]